MSNKDDASKDDSKLNHTNNNLSPNTSPFNSPRSETANSPRFDHFMRGMRIPDAPNNPSSSSSSFLTAGIHFIIVFKSP